MLTHLLVPAGLVVAGFVLVLLCLGIAWLQPFIALLPLCAARHRLHLPLLWLHNVSFLLASASPLQARALLLLASALPLLASALLLLASTLPLLASALPLLSQTPIPTYVSTWQLIIPWCRVHDLGAAGLVAILSQHCRRSRPSCVAGTPTRCIVRRSAHPEQLDQHVLLGLRPPRRLQQSLKVVDPGLHLVEHHRPVVAAPHPVQHGVRVVPGGVHAVPQPVSVVLVGALTVWARGRWRGRALAMHKELLDNEHVAPVLGVPAQDPPAFGAGGLLQVPYVDLAVDGKGQAVARVQQERPQDGQVLLQVLGVEVRGVPLEHFHAAVHVIPDLVEGLHTDQGAHDKVCTALAPGLAVLVEV
mmetsp:Transcript_108209/g.186826  ORF Transcript_108209/g.186826 Transcript_108209/m.186826 type:complete len:360 (+) Transcript_108209:568-1647(+)